MVIYFSVRSVVNLLLFMKHVHLVDKVFSNFMNGFMPKTKNSSIQLLFIVEIGGLTLLVSASALKFAWNSAFVWISIVAAVVIIGYLLFTFAQKKGRYKS